MSCLESGMSYLESGMSNLDSGMSYLESGMSYLESGMSYLESVMSYLESVMSYLESGMSYLESGMSVGYRTWHSNNGMALEVPCIVLLLIHFSVTLDLYFTAWTNQIFNLTLSKLVWS